MPKNISRSQKKGGAGSEQPLTLLDAVRQVGDEAFQNVYKLAQEREALRRKGVSRRPSRGGKMINYFEPAATAEEEIIRRIKGNYRRRFVSRAIQDEGVNSVPDAWKNHDISGVLKGWLAQQNPQFRGGEDLPDLENGEVEIARLTLANSVHGEVTSLRAKLTKPEGKVSLRMVDEYESEIKLPYQLANMPLTSEQVIGLFRDADPTATKFGCEIEFQSFFHADLNEVAKRLGVK